MSEDMDHTIAAKPARAASPGDNIKNQLRSLVERIEALEADKKAVSEDLRDVYTEAKGNGFDTKALRSIMKMRRTDPTKRREEEAVLGTYLAALGMI